MNRRPLPIVVPVLLCAVLAWSAAPALAATPNMFARVSAAGILISGSEVSSVAYLGPGQYEVTFSSAVTSCAYVATTAHIYAQALTVFTAGGHLSGNGVYVETKNQGGGLTDGQFELVVDCGNNGMKYAVVGYSANLVRATAGTTLTNLGSGRYNVTFAPVVKNCGYIATVGDPGSALVFSPAGVYTGTGPNTNTVYIETKNPAGGLSAGIPFHLAVICANTHARYAVVDDTGIIKRGSTLTGSLRSSTGEYTVATTLVVDPKCAAVATRGSVSTAVPFTPATVELVPSPASNARSFEVRDLLFFGGALANQAFHAAVVCR